jgi:hypothetical protein
LAAALQMMPLVSMLMLLVLMLLVLMLLVLVMLTVLKSPVVPTICGAAATGVCSIRRRRPVVT